MRAMLLSQTGSFQAGDEPLKLTELPLPIPKSSKIRIHVSACGVCHTELDEADMLGCTRIDLLTMFSTQVSCN